MQGRFFVCRKGSAAIYNKIIKPTKGQQLCCSFVGFIGRKGFDECEHIQKYRMDIFRTSKAAFFRCLKRCTFLKKARPTVTAGRGPVLWWTADLYASKTRGCRGIEPTGRPRRTDRHSCLALPTLHIHQLRHRQRHPSFGGQQAAHVVPDALAHRAARHAHGGLDVRWADDV